MPLGEGSVLGRRYRLLSQIGRGGMGTVWHAHDDLLDRDVAVKEVLFPPGLTDAEHAVLYERTLREARSAARLTHPGIVTVHDVVEEDGRPCIVMEFVRARSLQEIIDDGVRPVPGQVAEIGTQVLAALRVAHDAGILHRDIKPANVLLAGWSAGEPISRATRVVITDFGIARMAGDTTLTQTGLVLGSPAYISPERARGETASPASDLWSLGATLYATCEGRPPHHRAEAMAALTAVLAEEAPPPRHAGELAPVLMGLLAKEPERRMAAGEAADALRRVAQPPRSLTGDRPARPMARETAQDIPQSIPRDLSRDVSRGLARDVPRDLAGDVTEDASRNAATRPPPRHAPGLRPEAYAPAAGHAQARSARLPAGAYGPATRRHDAASGARGGPDGVTVDAGPPMPGPWAPGRGGETGPPAPAAPPPRRRRRTLFTVLAGVAALIVVASVMAVVLNRADRGRRHGTSTGSSSPPASSPTTVRLPPGWHHAAGPAGSSLAVPNGWVHKASTSSVIWTAPKSGAYVQVDITPWGVSDPAEHWRRFSMEAPKSGNLPGFRSEGIVPTRFLGGREVADLRFTWKPGRERMRGYDRGFTANGRQYVIFVAAPVRLWPRYRGYSDTIYRSFRPGP